MMDNDHQAEVPEAPSARRLALRELLGGGVAGMILGGMLNRWIPWGRVCPDTASAEERLPGLDHEAHMRRAIAQARLVPRLPFGAVIVRRDSGEVLAEGHNRSAVSPTYHGEIDVINRLASERAPSDWSDLVLYTTAEPCPMCQSAIAWAGIGAVVFGSSIPFLTRLGWHQIDIRAAEVIRRTPFRDMVILGGVLESECNALFEVLGPRGG